MKKLIIVILVLLFSSGIKAQNITNTLPSGGKFIVKDATNTFLTLMQSTGNVGVGSNTFDPTNPEKLLVDCGTTNSVNAIYAKGSINNYFQFNIQNLSTGTQASSDIVATANNGTETTNFMDIGINGSNYVYTTGNPILTGKANDCYILASGKDFYITNNSTSDDIIFLVGGTDTLSQRLRLFANGNVAIGSVWNEGYKFQVKVDATREGHVTSTGSWSSSSDLRLKKNIHPLLKSLELVMHLNPVRYDWKTDKDSEEGKRLGFIAQELEQYLPEFVDTDLNGMKSIDYSTLTSVLAGAIKEQQVIIESQNRKIENLESRLIALEQKSGISNPQNADIIYGSSNTSLWILLSAGVLSLGAVVIKKYL